MEVFYNLKPGEDVWVEGVDLGICQHKKDGLKLKSEQDYPGKI